MSAESAPNPPWALTRLSPAVTPSNLKPIDAAISRKNNKPAMTRQKKTTYCLRVRPSELCCCVVLMSVIILSAANGAFGQAAFGAAPGGAGGASNSAAAGLLPFPEGRGPDGTLYKTDYRCEGENMTVSCEASDGPGLDGSIRVVRANFGRFSIAICNRHGQTDWNVNCFAPQTTKILQQKCNGQSECVVEVNSSNFHDACPGTLKYLEIHYACTSRSPQVKPAAAGKQPPLPPWLIERGKVKVPTAKDKKGAKNRQGVKSGKVKTEATSTASTLLVRKPILVTDRPSTDLENKRVPITTPRPTTTTKKAVKTTPKATRASPTTTLKSTTSSKPTTVSSSIVEPVNFVDLDDDYETEEDRKLSVNNRFSGDTESSSSCPPKTARQLQWDWTPAGQPAIQPCPIAATGLAKWTCVDSPEGAHWLGTQPDMSGCKSVAVDNLEAQVRKEDPETVLVSSLAYLTRTKSLYGGDLESTVAIMRTVASRLTFRLQSGGSFHNKESHVRQVVQDVLRSASNILEESNRRAWMDLQADRQKKVATNLLLALEENAFLLAGVVDEPTEILETQEIMTMAISVVDTGRRRAEKGLTFPSKPLLYVDDAIRVPQRDLEDNAQGRVSESVFFSFSTLHEILDVGNHIRLTDDTRDVRNHVLNSRVISASLGRPGRHIELKEPVTINLRHIKDQNMTDPICVFWDYEVHAWSDSGCRLVATNATGTTCQCNHLTNFALLMKYQEPSALLSIRLDIVAYVVVSVVVIALLLVLIKYRRRVFEWCSCCCGRNLSFRKSSQHVVGRTGSGCFCCSTGSSKHNLDNKCQSFYTGLSSQNHSQYVLTGQPLQAQSLLQGGEHAATMGHQPYLNNTICNGYLGNNGLLTMATPNGIKTLRPHITLNPYSTQLVESINLMMPSSNNNSTTSSDTSSSDPVSKQCGSVNSSASNTTSTTLGRQQVISPQLTQLTNTLRGAQPEQPSNGDVVYRAVSPHGHVYWEIDPGQVYAAAVAANSGTQPLNEENVSLLVSNQADHIRPGMIMTANATENSPNVIAQQQQRPSAFVRNRFRQPARTKPTTPMVQSPNVTSGAEPPQQQVPEQLQTQVQIRDIKPIQVSVKSSEYIEAKIRTLRNNSSMRQ